MKQFIEKLITRLEKDNRIGRKSFEAIVDDINQLAESHHIHCEQEYMKGYEDARKNVGWIPVSERLPEDCSDVICITHLKGYVGMNVVILWYNAKLRKWMDTTDEVIDNNLEVVAWQPLPQPYKEEGVKNE